MEKCILNTKKKLEVFSLIKMKENILIINICKEKLHYFEFVKPILDILDNHNIKYNVKSYLDINKRDLENCAKVIICGTSLYDNDFIKNTNKFKWIRDFSKPILGICGGMQIIGNVFGGKVLKKTEIGFYIENFYLDFLGLHGEHGVYHLHNNYIHFKKLKKFRIYCGDFIPQAIKHKEKEIYGVLFHPEVRQKMMILNFCKL
jgi:GMP synthase-like glutamine amidotransferase